MSFLSHLCWLLKKKQKKKHENFEQNQKEEC